MIRRIARRLSTLLSQYASRNIYFGNLDAYHDLSQDEYVQWLSCIVGGYLDSGNVVGFEYCIRNMPAKGAIVEIGSFLGLSTNVLAYAAHKYKRTNPFFACDPWAFAGYGKTYANYFNNGTQEYRAWAKQVFKMNTSLFSRDIGPYSIETFSDRFFEWWQAQTQATDLLGRGVILGGPIAFAYIDGDHSYEGAKKDFENVDRHLVPGGFVLLDDSADNCRWDGVKRLAAEVTERAGYELALKCPNYCFKKRG